LPPRGGLELGARGNFPRCPPLNPALSAGAYTFQRYSTLITEGCNLDHGRVQPCKTSKE